MKRLFRFALLAAPFAIFLFSFFNSSEVQSSSFRPPTGRTQDPVNNSTCAASSCHDSWAPFALERAVVTIGTTQANQQPLSGFQFTLGTQYIINISVIGTANRYGFQMSALRGSANAGTFAATNSNTFVQTQNGISYIGHQNASGSVSSWSFNWTAPSTGSGNITFYTAINKAYSPTGDSNDSIFHRSYTISPAPVVPPAIVGSRDTTICAGNSVQLNTTVSGAQGTVTYSWQPTAGLSCTNCANPTATPSQTTNYIVTANAANGSVSDTVLITVNPNPSASIAGANFVCNGNSVQLTASGGNNYSWNQGLGSGAVKTVSPTATTTYTVTVANASNCTATASRTIEVRNSSSRTINQSICQGTTFPFKGQNLSQAGTYRDTLVNAVGCDSFVTLNLTVNSILQGAFNQSICQGGSFFFKGQNLTQAGTYKDTVKTQAGCDSVVTLNLSVQNKVLVSLSRSICDGDSFLFKGIARKTAGVYADTLTALGGCDSITTLNLTLNARPTANAGTDKTITKNCAVSVQLGSTPTASGGTIPYLFEWQPTVGLSSPTSPNPIVSNPNSTTTYSITVTDGNNCTSTSSVTVNVETLTSAFTQSGNLLTASQNYFSYQWLKNSLPINGATASSFTVTETGNYALVAGNPDGCKDTSQSVLITISSVESAWGGNVYWAVFPNPARETVIVSLSGNANANIQVLGVDGALIQQFLLEGNTTKLSLQNLEQGMYFIRLTNAFGSSVKRLNVVK